MIEMTTVVAQVRDNPDRSRHEVLLGGQVVGFSAYQLIEDRLILAHVEIIPDHGGQGLASRLVSHQLDEAARRGLGVVPVCPFVRKVITDAPDTYLPLVAAEHRALLSQPPQAK